jgi:hypothetical protein
VTKIVPSNSIVSLVYDNGGSDKIMTFVRGMKKRDEAGIDVCPDHLGRHWILQKEAVVGFTVKGITLDQFTKLDLPADHPYDRIFRIGSTIGLYGSSSNRAAILCPDNQFATFSAPEGVTLIQFPAFCTKDFVFICQKTAADLTNATIKDYKIVEASVKSCCWLARTLFAVEDNKIIAIGSRTGNKRVLDSLPNAMCAIAAAFPSFLIFVTAIPETRLITIKQPFLSNVAVIDVDESDLDAFRYMLSYMPKLPIDPRVVSSLPPMFAMAVFNKSPPKFVDDDVIRIYSKFARFMELQNLVRHTRGGASVLLKVAHAARRIGQFEISRHLYEEVGAFQDLFSLFVLTRNPHNLAVLASRSPLARPIEAGFGITPKTGQYEPLPNLQLPRIRSPHTGIDFVLFPGDPSEASPLYPPSFDELSDFGIREYSLAGVEVDVGAASAPPPVYEPPALTDEPPAASRPPEIDNKDLVMTKYFDDEPDEPRLPTVAFEFKVPEPGTRKRYQTVVNRAKRPFTLVTAPIAPVPSEPVPPTAAEADQEPPPAPPTDSSQYTSSLFL